MTLEEYNELKLRFGWGEEFIISYKGTDFWISQNSNLCKIRYLSGKLL